MSRTPSVVLFPGATTQEEFAMLLLTRRGHAGPGTRDIITRVTHVSLVGINSDVLCYKTKGAQEVGSIDEESYIPLELLQGWKIR